MPGAGQACYGARVAKVQGHHRGGGAGMSAWHVHVMSGGGESRPAGRRGPSMGRRVPQESSGQGGGLRTLIICRRSVRTWYNYVRRGERQSGPLKRSSTGSPKSGRRACRTARPRSRFWPRSIRRHARIGAIPSPRAHARRASPRRSGRQERRQRPGSRRGGAAPSSGGA